MSGSAKPKRRRAAGAALRYEHVRQRPSAWAQARERASRGEGFGGCLILLAAMAAFAGFALMVMTWGSELWGGTAPAWPGDGYGFAATVGAVLPLGLAAVIVTLDRMKWKTSPLRSLGWMLASLPGVAACFLWAVVVFAAFRPKHRRDWDSACYSRGNPCWVHAEYPYVWAVGLLATVLVAAALITVLIRIANAREKTPSA
ncbi:hypothetical protein AB8A21_06450 [Streptomyces sp. BF23-18]|uniref:hypothetical protein n=1 Tax=Streptomyces sp. BF23-18 TaxID=3240282 RepID=UPI0034E49A43